MLNSLASGVLVKGTVSLLLQVLQIRVRALQEHSKREKVFSVRAPEEHLIPME